MSTLNLPRRIAWYLFAFLCIAISFYPIMYFINGRNFALLSSKAEYLMTSIPWNLGFYTHITFGGIALLVGWMQFSNTLRTKRPRLHRRVGRTYVLAVMLGGLAGFSVAFFAEGGWIARTGFVLLGAIWLSTTFLALQAARKREFRRHQVLAIFSYAACFSAVTLRIWLPILTSLTGEFYHAYQIVAWLCWVPNLLVAYWLISRARPLNQVM